MGRSGAAGRQRFSQPPKTIKPVARPFVKWAGGKGSIADKIIEKFPDKIERYYEPFTGGGAVFFRSSSRIKQAYLTDINLELMVTYQMIKKCPEELIKKLENHKSKHNKDYYYKIRNLHGITDNLERAARVIYLNKTCYNGLYRVNKKGSFNVPMGGYKAPKICDAVNIRNCSRVLQDVDIKQLPFYDVNVESGSLVYCDPPYHGTYGGYSGDSFSEDDQGRLAECAREWSKHSLVIISNSDTPFIRHLYDFDIFTIHEVEAPRSISCKGDERKKVTELLIVGGNGEE